MSSCNPVRVGDLWFSSQIECALYFGVNKCTVRRKLDNGTIDTLLEFDHATKKGQRRVRCIETGREWPSAEKCGMDLGICPKTISKRALNGKGLVYLNEVRK